MAQKFLTNVELEAGLVDGSNSTGTSGYLLSSTGTATSWVDPAAVSVGESEQVHIACKNTSGVAISKGDPVYITGTVGTSFIIEIAAADASNSAKMPAVGLAETNLGINAEGFVIVSGILKNLTTDPLSTSDGTPSSNNTVYVKAGGGLTRTKPTGSGNLIQNVGKVGRVNSANAGSLAVSTIMRTNDVPNLTTGKIWVGSPTYTTESTVVHLDETNGRMGIGTSSPEGKLHVKINDSGATPISQQHLILENNSATGLGILTPSSTSGYIFFGDENDAQRAYISYSHLFDHMAFKVNGSERVRITNTGNFGIGTTSPSQKAVISGPNTNPALNTTAVSSATLLLSNSDTAYGTYFCSLGTGTGLIQQRRQTSAVYYDLAINPYGGNVGIGTTSPATKLHVDGNVLFEESGDHMRLRLVSDATDQAIIYFGDHTNNYEGRVAYQNSNDSLYFTTAGAEKMRITSTGNVGIGTTSPTQALHVAGNARVTGAYYDSNNSAGTSGQVLSSTGTGTDWVDAASGGIGGSGTVNYIPKWSNSSTLTNSGIVETSTLTTINNASFEYDYSGNTYLNIDGTTGTFLLGRPSTANRVYIHGIQSHLRFYTDNVKAGEFDSSQNFLVNNGNVGIGEVNPAQKLHVIGNSEITGDIFLGRYIFHNDDTNTWLGFPSADTISFRTNGSDRMYINSSGNVGIGTTSPGAKLDVVSGDIRLGTNATYFRVRDTASAQPRVLGMNASNTFYIGPIDSYAGGAMAYGVSGNLTYHGFYGGGSEKVRITSSGNVGIGTTSPASQLGSTKVLDISSTGNGEIILDHTDAGISSDIGLYSWNRNNDHLAHIKATCDGATDSAFISFHAQPTGGSFSNAASNEKMRIKSNGNVGIGTTNPTEKLFVNGGNAKIETTGTTVLKLNSNTSFPSVQIQAERQGGTSPPMGQLRWDVNPGALGMQLIYWNGYTENSLKLDGSNFKVINNGSERMRITSTGDVGIGTTSPSYKLDVDGVIRGEQYLRLRDTAGTNQFSIRAESTYGTLDNGSKTFNYIASNHLFLVGASEKMRLNSSGNVGIGISAISEKLEVNGSIKATATTDAYKGYIKQNVISYAAEKTETSNYYFTAYNTTSTVTLAQAYNRIVAAYNGRVKKVYIRHAGASTPTATAVNFKKHTNGITSSTVYSATVANTASTNMTAYYEFGNNDFTFNAGDLIGLLYQTTDAFGTASKTMGGVAVTITLEYNIT